MHFVLFLQTLPSWPNLALFSLAKELSPSCGWRMRPALTPLALAVRGCRQGSNNPTAKHPITMTTGTPEWMSTRLRGWENTWVTDGDHSHTPDIARICSDSPVYSFVCLFVFTRFSCPYPRAHARYTFLSTIHPTVYINWVACGQGASQRNDEAFGEI